MARRGKHWIAVFAFGHDTEILSKLKFIVQDYMDIHGSITPRDHTNVYISEIYSACPRMFTPGTQPVIRQALPR
jgi:hypothetical protein